MGKLVLFDIDGILVKSIATGGLAYLMRKYFDVEPVPSKVYAEGKTFRWIFKQKLLEAGVENPDEKKEFREAMDDVSSIKDAINKGLKVEKIEGVEDLIKNLRERGHTLGLLTGNSPNSAKVKLEEVRLWKYFEIGAFGSETETRSKLVPLAIGEARNNLQKDFDKGDVVIIGDTVEDIKCAKEAGVKGIAVSTGKESLEELNSENPDFSFENFNNIDGIVSAIEER